MDTSEDEFHFLLHCPKHILARNLMFSKIEIVEITLYSETDKFNFLFCNPTIVKSTAQFIITAFDNRVLDG